MADTVHDAGGILDVHLMIERPERSAGEFIRAGADSVTVHAEATPHLAYEINLIHEAGSCAVCRRAIERVIKMYAYTGTK